MSLRIYVQVWILLLILLAGESWMLNFHPDLGIIGTLKRNGYFPRMSLNPQTGKSISLFLGWAGFIIMCATNIYVLRKRIFKNAGGKLSGWLNFHIFCGLLGPTLILFHTNFKIGGLVAVSFWSMVISFLSGIVGRYFYVQIINHKSELESLAKLCEQRFLKSAELPPQKLSEVKMRTFQLACVPEEHAKLGLLSSLFLSLRGDLQMKLSFSQLTHELNHNAQIHLKNLVIATRRRFFIEQFRILMGYWHSFHMPFAIFMYLVAAIHIATALLLGVGEIS